MIRLPSPKPVREGLAHKRAAILTAARDLFVQNGVERTSMDAVAAQAGVSKRTVYDYYGDKRGLLLGVIEDAGESLLRSLRTTIERHLSDVIQIRDTAELELALTAFSVEFGESMLTSSDYAATVKLISENRSFLPELTDHPLDVAPEEAIAERIEHFAARGLLDAPDPRLAADQFTALTTLLAYSGSPSARADPTRVRRVLIDGAHTFMRAYVPRPPSIPTPRL